MNYILKGQTQKDLEEIWQYTYTKWGVKQANKYIDELVESFDYLTQNPLIYRENFEFDPPVRINPIKSHLVVYLITSRSNLSIIRILHKKMDINSIL